jgi:nitroreductase
MKDLYALMQQRRSLRKYLKTPIPADRLNRVLQAGGMAPSGANRQPWLYVLVDDPGIKGRIRRSSEAADARWNEERNPAFRRWLKSQDIEENSKPFLEEAPLLLCVFGDSTQPYWLESVWLSIGYLILAAEQEGLGTLTYTPGYPGFLNDLLEVPAGWVPQAILPLGFPGEEPAAAGRRRKEPETFVHCNRYQRGK